MSCIQPCARTDVPVNRVPEPEGGFESKYGLISTDVPFVSV